MGKLDILKGQVSRRSFMKGSLALGAAVSLFGCSKEEAELYGYGDNSNLGILPDLVPGTIEGEEYYGATPHNCGGENCVLKAYVQNGAVKRIVTDERPDIDMGGGIDNPQDRACPRCRGRKSTLYYSNRLKYPLIQTGTRGDLTTFKKATWQEAMDHLVTKLAELKTNCGNGSIYGLYGSGAGGTLGINGQSVAGIGTSLTHDSGVTHGFEGYDTDLRSAFGPIHDYSWPAWEHVTPIVQGYYAYAQANDAASNAYNDALNANVIVIWGHNMSETQWTPQISYYLAQIKENNPDAKIYLIDGRFTQTAVLMESHKNFQYVGIANGTDAALIMGMVNHILTDTTCYNKLKSLYGLGADATDAQLRQAVGKYLFGFFDTDDADGADINETYHPHSAGATFNPLTNEVLKVQPGASWSAYICGNRQHNANKAASIYPDQIGYNVRSYELPEWDYKTQTWSENKLDNFDKQHTFCYGQVDKTPAWASRVTGVPEELIKQLAEDFLDEKVTVWSGSGFQRCSESEEIVRSWICFNTLVRNYGLSGASFGSVGKKGGKGGNIAAHATGTPGMAGKTEDGYSLKTGAGIITDPAKGGYNRKAINTPINDTLGARTDFNFCTVDPSKAGLTRAYNMEACGTTPNLTPCFTWLENVEASLMAPVTAEKITYNNGSFTKANKQIRPARWNTGSNQTVSTPVGCITQMSGNQIAVTDGNINLHTGIYKKEDFLDFVVICDNVMTPSCRYADLVLPGSMGFERYTVSGNSWGAGRNAVFTGRATLPPGEALSEVEIGLLIAQATGGDAASYINGAAGVPTDINAGNIVARKGEFEEAFWKASYEETTLEGKPATWEEAKKGFFIKDKDPLKNEGYNGVTAGANSGYDADGINTVYAAYRNDPKTNKLNTYTGRVEAYSLAYMEDYEARFFTNADTTTYTNLYTLAADGVTAVNGGSSSISLKNSGKIYSKSTSAVNDGTNTSANGQPNTANASSAARFVYPVPMYIPLIEGRHATTYSNGTDTHPAAQGVYGNYKTNSYDLTLNTWHIMYRSHSTHNSSGLLNEVKYYKRDYKGEPTYFTKDLVEGANSATDYTAITDYTKGAYETCWLNPSTASAKGIVENDLVVIENDRGAIVASAHLSQRVSPGAVYIGHGSWYNPVSLWTSPTGKQYQNIDVGGCANTLTNTRPSRMCQGMTLANDCRVKISKA